MPWRTALRHHWRGAILLPQRARLCTICACTANNCLVLNSAGTGTPSLSESIELTKLSFDLGYDGVVVLPPYYFRKATDEGLFNWFSELITKAVPANKYLLGYHIPSAAGRFSLNLLG
jgi:dihydrodipicolinate synthase/N-acetylneuraminate lyase